MKEFPRCVSQESFDQIPPTTEAKKFKKFVRIKKPTPKQPQKQKKTTNTATKKADMARMKAWREHRHRVLNISREVDNNPPGFQAARLTGVNVLRENAVAFMERTKKNVQMLVELSNMNRTHGVINPFRYERVFTTSSLPLTMKILDRIEEENLDLATRIVEVVSEIDSGMKTRKGHLKQVNRYSKQPFTMDVNSLKKYKGYNFEMPKTNKERWQLFRPRVYFDIYLKDARPLGRIVVELYTEAAPVVVLEIVRACMCNQHERFLITRLFPSLWFDVNLSLHANTQLSQPLEYDGKVIDHGEFGHVLSFSKDYLQGFKDNLSFSMSFKPLRVVNGARVGFGRVIKGSKIIDCLQSYGTKNGKLFRGILFTGCGFL